MQPAGGRGGEDGCNTPAIGHQDRDRHVPSHSSPAHSSPERSPEEQQEHEQEDEHRKQPMAGLTEDGLVEILSRVPYKSLCRFKCVSKPWLALCSATDIRRRSPQTLSGFFDNSRINMPAFHYWPRRGPPMDPTLPFLRESYKRITIEQCSGSLLLCQCSNSCSEEEEYDLLERDPATGKWAVLRVLKISSIHFCQCGELCSEGEGYDYVVCNPATERWVVLPRIALRDGQPFSLDPRHMFLGFDTAAPSRFVVFAFLTSCDDFAEASIYSSETGRWTSVQNQWGPRTVLFGNPNGVFLNGIMHVTAFYSSLATVDAQGKVWRKIEIPDIRPGRGADFIPFIGQSQGRLYAWRIGNRNDPQLYVWVLEDCDNGKWTLKHNLDIFGLFRRHLGDDVELCWMFAIHPECNLIFLTDGQKMTLSYDMDNHKVDVISTSKEFFGGQPYTPCFAE